MTDKPTLSTAKMQPGELQKFNDMGLGAAKLQSDAERELYALRNNADPERLKLITDASPTTSKSTAAAREAAQADYRKLQTNARVAEQQRAEAAEPEYSDEQISEALTKIGSIKLGLTQEAQNFKKALFDYSHPGHRIATEHWREWNKVAGKAKR